MLFACRADCVVRAPLSSRLRISRIPRSARVYTSDSSGIPLPHAWFHPNRSNDQSTGSASRSPSYDISRNDKSNEKRSEIERSIEKERAMIMVIHVRLSRSYKAVRRKGRLKQKIMPAYPRCVCGVQEEFLSETRS